MSRRRRADGESASKEQAHRDASIQVLNMSFPRCGTMSIQAALDQLGYKCWHSTTCFGNTTQCRRWIAAQDAKFLQKGTPFTRADWDAVFDSYTAISADPPAFGFAQELITAYPDAKVILVEREEEAWFASFEATVMHNLFRWDLNLVSDMDPHLFGPVRDMQRHWVCSWWRVNSRDEMRVKARSMYREHNRTIRALTPPHRLLEFKLQDGWAPLCKFLDKDVPDMPFPAKNDRAEVKDMRRFILMRGLYIVSIWMLKTLGPGVMCAAAWWLFGKSPPTGGAIEN